MTTVIYHRADYDGVFCREIAKHFLGADGVRYIGWDFGDPPVPIPERTDKTYVLDLPLDKVFGTSINPEGGQPFYHSNIIWIDHHKSAIESHPKGYSRVPD